LTSERHSDITSSNVVRESLSHIVKLKWVCQRQTA
jgi:hypothetical protein